jgi:alpha-beta hydrolase superfamily lysophospholipase
MAEARPQTSAASWTEPEGLLARGTLILAPGRGEQPEVYERFGRRISSDAFRVHVAADPVTDAALAESQVKQQLDGSGATVPGPVVLVGSDTGALFAAGLLASGTVSGVDALILAGLPADGRAGDTAPADWDDELGARTTCPTHRGRLADGLVRPGALYEPVPEGWADRADLARITQPVLGLHGTDDPVSPLSAVRARYAAAPNADLVSVTGTTHDALNNATHRTVAATVILFLERLRQGAGLTPIAVHEDL